MIITITQSSVRLPFTKPAQLLEPNISLSLQKSIARKTAARIRETAHKKLAQSAASTLGKCGLGFLGSVNGKTISGFMPFRSEISILKLLKTLALNGCTTCLPIVVAKDNPLQFRKWQPDEELTTGKWEIPIPLSSAPVVNPDILLIPLLAFDKKGYRLGYGGGFYDRTIEKLLIENPVTTIGVAYSAQQIDQVPTDDHDQKLDWILTEKGPVNCG